MKKKWMALFLAATLCLGVLPAKAAAGPELEVPGEESDEEPETTDPESMEPEAEEEPAMQEDDEAVEEVPDEEPKRTEALTSVQDPETASLRDANGGGGRQPFPYQDIICFEIEWKQALTGKVAYKEWYRNQYAGGKWVNRDFGTEGSLSDLTNGTYTVTITIQEGDDGKVLLDPVEYEHQFAWPSADEVTLKGGPGQEGTLSGEITGTGGVRLGEWSLNASGYMTLKIEDNPTTRADSEWGGTIGFQVSLFSVGDGDDPDAAQAAMEKTGELSIAQEKIFWELTATIPRYVDGTASAWSVKDQLLYPGNDGDIPNTMEDVTVTLLSNEYPQGLVLPEVSQAGADDPFAYVRQQDGKDPQLLLLNQCACTSAEDCRSYADGCTTYPGGDGTSFCSCWRSLYHATLSIRYSVDVGAYLEQLGEAPDSISSQVVKNYAFLYENGKAGPQGYADVQIWKLLTKEETVSPDHGPEAIGTYTIQVNPHHMDYTGAADLTVTDTMENLTHRADAPMHISTEQGELSCIDPAAAVRLDPVRDQAQYYSVSYEEVREGEASAKTGEIMTIQIWYPTDAAYTITYDAMVLAPGAQAAYRNQAQIGHVTCEVTGRMSDGWSDWWDNSRLVALKKVDAGNPDLVLSGAVFDVYRYDDAGEDLYLTTLSTQADGTAAFCSDRTAGYLLCANTLYYLKETQAPAGYQLDETALYFYIQEEEGTSVPLPEAVSIEEGNLCIFAAGEETEKPFAVTVTNVKEGTDEMFETINISVEKIWDDAEDAAGIRPESILVELLQNGEPTGCQLSLSEENDWTGSFTGLPLLTEGEENDYDIQELKVKGYVSEITGDAAEGYVITNTPEKGEGERTTVKTGDTHALFFWMGLLLLAGILLAVRAKWMSHKIAKT